MSNGFYAVNFCSMVFQGEQPESICAKGQLTEEGTDELAAITLVYKGGRIAQLTCGTAYNLPIQAIVCGTKGEVKVPQTFWCPTKLETPDGLKEYPLPEPPLPLNYGSNSVGMRYEAEEVRKCLKEGKKESAVMPHQETLLVAKMMEDAMKQMGVVYFKH